MDFGREQFLTFPASTLGPASSFDDSRMYFAACVALFSSSRVHRSLLLAKNVRKEFGSQTKEQVEHEAAGRCIESARAGGLLQAPPHVAPKFCVEPTTQSASTLNSAVELLGVSVDRESIPRAVLLRFAFSFAGR